MCIVELGKPCVLKLSYTIENGECLLAIRETCSEVMNISYVSLLLWSWSPDIQSAGLKPNLSPRHLMHFLFPLCAGKNSKLLIHIEAKISEPWANWFRYYSMKLANHCIECSGKVGLFLSFFFFFLPKKASWALWRNSLDFWSSSDIVEPVWLQLFPAYGCYRQLCPMDLEKSVRIM